ncbi:DUF5009 domain-containing protein [Stenotrophomonas sp. C3(2023)]|uniref:acyltransferase family protein n=1 Tax=Stenotrophomonas sp. C3(2023) TaxID=3080277 RepID=UPI00293C7A96|nr:heparan-alpha-glucosaminide N-acetyltransferase domain-containing protein [Stenotrophomonas sp. C3(2023)]MDV3467538.1 DUF5009 domain-containing protein [Stenotrophomonas sp. C3(2023)]
MSAAPGARLASIDALRGMTVAAMLLVNNPGDWGHVYAPLQHAVWDGCTPTDLVFPFFLLLVGVSLAFSVAPRAHDTALRPALARGVVQRALRILAAGAVLHLLIWWALDVAHFRLWGVLQRIAVCAAGVGLLAVYGSRRLQGVVLLALLLGYAAVLMTADSLAPLVNPASRLDTALFAPWLYQWDPVTGRGHDPEGLLSTLGALATTLLGLLAGQLLRAGRLRALGSAAGLALLLGWVGADLLPWNKQLWTPSYVLWTGGWAMLALLLAHLLIDQRGWPALGRRFGVNAITAYLGSGVMTVGLIASGAWAALQASALALLGDAAMASLACAVAFVAVWWAIMWWLDARRLYLKI